MSFASILFINLLFKIMSSIMTKKQSSKSLQKEGSSNLKTTSITSANIIKSNRSKSPSIKKFVKEILAGNVSYLSRAITLIESTNKKHQKKANIILEQCLPFANKSSRTFRYCSRWMILISHQFRCSTIFYYKLEVKPTT